MVGPQEFLGPEDLQQHLKALQQEERELDRLRAILAPDYWPRIYVMLDRVRKEIRDVEKYVAANRDAA